MPFLTCEKSKQKMRVSTMICFNNQCKHLKVKDKTFMCGYKSKGQKALEKRKKK